MVGGLPCGHFILINLMIFSWTSNYFVDSRDSDDYWSVKYDINQNCAQQEKIQKLRNQEETNLPQCAMEQVPVEQVGDYESDEGGKKKAFDMCKLKLGKLVRQACGHTALNSSGELLYCNNRGITTCCFEKHTCVKDWETMQDRIYTTAKEYLTNPESFLDKNIRPMGYKTCHVLNSSLDATVCAKDCDRQEKQKFAKDCKKKGGLFKCCIRRDKAFCNECRFCCTISLCTYPSSYGVKSDFDMRWGKGLKDQKNKETAKDFFMSEQHIYKTWDYRCLVPYSDKDPTKWKTYDMHEYRRAYNEKTLKRVSKYRYDKYFFNWVDPKVLKYFTKSTKGMKRAWRKIYGLPYSTPMVWDGRALNPMDQTKCFIKCARYEKNKFAEKCRKRGGFFKCCVQLLYMNIFERTRNNLILDGLIKDKPTSFCRPIGDLGLDNCHICTTDAMCTEMDTATGKVTHTFFKGSKKHQNIGGPLSEYPRRFGLRFAWCQIGDLCNERQGWYYDHTRLHGNKYRDAVSQKEQCKIKLTGHWNNTKTEAEIEEMRKEYHNYCPKSKSNNIIYCPKNIIKKRDKNMKLKRLNDLFNKISTQKRKRKTKRKRKSKKSKRERKRSRKGKKTKKKKKKTKKRKPKKICELNVF